ncbi:MAG: BC1881 family protein [Clostridia bacterium]|nr:BC1881 family protein [Clostridia bacterium]
MENYKIDEVGRTALGNFTTAELVHELMEREGVKSINIEPYIEVEFKAVCNGKQTSGAWAKYGGFTVLAIYGN